MLENLLFFNFAPLATNFIRPKSCEKKVTIRLDSLKLVECKSTALEERRGFFNFCQLIYQKKREAVKPP